MQRKKDIKNIYFPKSLQINGRWIQLENKRHIACKRNKCKNMNVSLCSIAKPNRKKENRERTIKSQIYEQVPGTDFRLFLKGESPKYTTIYSLVSLNRKLSDRIKDTLYKEKKVRFTQEDAIKKYHACIIKKIQRQEECSKLRMFSAIKRKYNLSRELRNFTTL